MNTYEIELKQLQQRICNCFAEEPSLLKQFENDYSKIMSILKEHGQRDSALFGSTTSEIYIISPETPYYDSFLVYSLLCIDLLEIDSFLNYQLKKYFGNRKEYFNRFLKLALRKQQDKQNIPDSLITTIYEWCDLPIDSASFKTILSKANTKPSFEMISGDEIFNIQQAAEFLDLKVSTLYVKTSQKEIPHLKKGKKIYFYKKELQDWLKKGKVATMEDIITEAQTHLVSRKGQR